MSLADPQSLDIGAGAVSLARVGVGNRNATYLSADGNLELFVGHIHGSSRIRRTFRANVRKTAADPLFPAQNAPYSMSAFCSIDVPLVGFTSTEQHNALKALMVQLSASSYAVLAKVAQGES